MRTLVLVFPIIFFGSEMATKDVSFVDKILPKRKPGKALC